MARMSTSPPCLTGFWGRSSPLKIRKSQGQNSGNSNNNNNSRTHPPPPPLSLSNYMRKKRKDAMLKKETAKRNPTHSLLINLQPLRNYPFPSRTFPTPTLMPQLNHHPTRSMLLDHRQPVGIVRGAVVEGPLTFVVR